MEAVNWLLINVANAIHWLWGIIKGGLGAMLGALDAILNPVLSPILSVLNSICTGIGDVVYALLSPLPVWLGVTILSAVAGAAMLIAFRYTSNQAAIGRVKDEIKANLLALKLYKDELRVTFQAQGRLLWAIAKLQRYMLTPVLIALLPMLLGLGQMGVRYQWRPLHPGEGTVLTMRVDSDARDMPEPQLEPNTGMVLEVGPVPGGREFVWRIRGGKPGRHTLRFHVGDSVIEKELVVGDSFERVSAERPGRRWTAQILHPAERILPADSPVESIEILYPGVDSWIYGTNYWILYFFVVSMATALILKPLFKVNF